MGYSAEVAEVNDRVRRLAARVEEFDSIKEEALHPAVRQDEASAAVVAAVMGQLPYSRAGRELIAKAARREGKEPLSVAQAEAALAELMAAAKAAEEEAAKKGTQKVAPEGEPAAGEEKKEGEREVGGK